MLTKKQHLLLMFIDQRLRTTGVSPSFDEMKDALELKSKSGIHRLITGLEERGFIRRLPHRARALEVLKLPDNTPAVAKNSFSALSCHSVFGGCLLTACHKQFHAICEARGVQQDEGDAVLESSPVAPTRMRPKQIFR